VIDGTKKGREADVSKGAQMDGRRVIKFLEPPGLGDEADKVHSAADVGRQESQPWPNTAD
jgi:hypothetical protein